ncbi:MAG: TetR/AcrR family transcriptional regulator [Enterocloster sp.]
MADNTTKEKLLKAGIHLFAKHGYESTTTRMIAETAGTNIATMAFHFGNKENFYGAVLSYVAEIMRNDHIPFWNQVREAHMNRTPSPDEAWEMIETYVDQLLSILKNTNINSAYGNDDMLNLLFREQLMPVNNHYPITSVLCKESEAVLNLLLMDYWQNHDEKRATIVSRTVTGAIISFGEHPMFIRRALGYADDAVLEDDVWNTLRTFILNSIRSYTPGM